MTKDENKNTHGANCCCGHDHDSEHSTCHSYDENPLLSSCEKSLLLEILQNTYLPISEFMASSSVNEEIGFIALQPVYIKSLDDTMEIVKERKVTFLQLEKKGLITLDYEIPISKYDYSLHTNSELFKFFQKTIDDGKNNPEFACDIARLEPGSIALTELGHKISKTLK